MDWTPLDIQKVEEVRQVCARISECPHQILINVETQTLHLLKWGEWVSSYPISTALNGVGQKEGSGKTPLGWHFVESRIGEGAHPFEIFESRISIEKIALPNEGEESIVGRILWLEGAESGFNQGHHAEGYSVDSHDRYIYIHGTNDIARIRMPVSKGCIRMIPEDVIDLFDATEDKTPVYIYNGSN